MNYLLSVLCLVWAADIAAYFGGRKFGRRKRVQRARRAPAALADDAAIGREPSLG